MDTVKFYIFVFVIFVELTLHTNKKDLVQDTITRVPRSKSGEILYLDLEEPRSRSRNLRQSSSLLLMFRSTSDS